MQYSPKLKKAAEEIKSVLKKYDIAASVVLHTPGFSEFVLEITPSYSCATLNHDHVRFKAKKEDFNNELKRHQVIEDTANMMNLLSDTTAKNDDEVIIKRYMDRPTGLLIGLHTGVNDRTKTINHNYVKLEGSMMFDLSIPADRKLYIIAMRSPMVEGSPNQSGKPVYKLYDKQIIASKNIDKRSLRRKCEDIIESLKHGQLEEMARNIGVNVEANRNHDMLLDEVYRISETDPRKFIEIFENPNREYITIFHRARAKAIITLDFATNTFMYGSIVLGHSQDAAINFLTESTGLASAMKIQCDDIDKGTKQSMSFVKSEENELEKLRAENAALRANQNNNSAVVSEETKEESINTMDSLKKRAKELKIVGFALPHMTEAKLIKAIEEKEAELSQQ